MTPAREKIIGGSRKKKTLEGPKKTQRTHKTHTGGVSDDQGRRIRKLVREGMSEKLAHEEVLGKGYVEP